MMVGDVGKRKEAECGGDVGRPTGETKRREMDELRT